MSTTPTCDVGEVVDGARFRGVIGRFATGVAVVTTEWDGQLHGMTVNSLTSVSLDPVLLLVCLNRDSRTADAVVRRRTFVVNLLSEDQEDLCKRFSVAGGDHFGHGQYRLDNGLPVLGGGLGHIVCSLEACHRGGDHLIVLGRVRTCEGREGAPLLFYRGRLGAGPGAGGTAS